MGWPIRTDCPSPTHNSLRAGRRTPKSRCICPRARQLRSEFRQTENAKRRQREAKPLTLGVSAGRRPSVLEKIGSASFLPSTAETDTLAPECRIESLGGTLPDEKADYFHAEEAGGPSEVMREVAKSLCRRCPLQRECLTAAVENHEPGGIWGGLTAAERRDPRRVAMELRLIDSGGSL